MPPVAQRNPRLRLVEDEHQRLWVQEVWQHPSGGEVVGHAWLLDPKDARRSPWAGLALAGYVLAAVVLVVVAPPVVWAVLGAVAVVVCAVVTLAPALRSLR